MAGCSSTGSSEVTSAAERGLDTETLLATNNKPFIAASEIPQGDAEGLKSQLLNLKDGDELIIPVGQYEDLGQFDITASNVTIKAEEAGKAWLTGLVQINQYQVGRRSLYRWWPGRAYGWHYLPW